jgi:hypothetical protein
LGSEIDRNTEGLLNAIIAGHRANRAAIRELHITGTIEQAQSPAGEGERLPADTTICQYDYFELQGSRRIDSTVVPRASELELIREPKQIVVGLAERCITHTAGTPGALIRTPDGFHMQSWIAYVDNLVISPAWKDHVGQIQYLLNRGWKPEKESIEVRTVSDPEYGTLLEVAYESTRGGGLTKWSWVFSPECGYEVVRGTASGTYPSGDPSDVTVCSYEVIELQPGVWRAVGADVTTHNWEEDGKQGTMTLRIKAEKGTANSGGLTPEFFTLAGMGVPPGSWITDQTGSDPLFYKYEGPPVENTETEPDKLPVK